MAFLLCASLLPHFEARAMDESDLEGITLPSEMQAVDESRPEAEIPQSQAVDETVPEGGISHSQMLATEQTEPKSEKSPSERLTEEEKAPETGQSPSEARVLKETVNEDNKPRAEASTSLDTDLENLKPPLMTREMWNAEPALDGMWPHKPKGIVIHHTGVARNLHSTLPQKMKGLQHFSQRMMHPGPLGRTIWLDAPYHFYIDAKGELAEGREAMFTSDSNTFYDTYGLLQVVVEGDFQREVPDPRQMETLRRTLVWLSLKWDIHPDRIVWHRAKAPTNCPGRNLLNQLPQLSVAVLQSRQQAIDEICAKLPSAEFQRAYCTFKDSYAGIH